MTVDSETADVTVKSNLVQGPGERAPVGAPWAGAADAAAGSHTPHWAGHSARPRRRAPGRGRGVKRARALALRDYINTCALFVAQILHTQYFTEGPGIHNCVTFSRTHRYLVS